MIRSLRFRSSPLTVLFFVFGCSSCFAKHKNSQTAAQPQAPKRMNITITKRYTNSIMHDKNRTQTGTAIIVLDEKYIKNTQAKTVAELLQAAPSVSVVNSGGLGQKTSVFIRGASSENTVVVIDGIRMDDKSNAAGGFDFANLMADGIERIEIIRGSQSALWGSDALGGVINITTKTGSQGFHPNASLVYGSRHYAKQFININGGNNKALYSVSFANLSTDGIDTKKDPNSDPDTDGYKNKLINAKASNQFNEIFSLDGVARYTDVTTDFDGETYTPGKDNHAFSRQKQLTSKLNAHLNLFNKHWLNRLSVSNSKIQSTTTDPQNTYTDPRTKNEGAANKGEIQSDYLLTTGHYNHRFTLVSELEKSTYKPWNGRSSPKQQTMHNTAMIGQYGLNWAQRIFLSGSLRRDINSDFDNTTTYKLALSAWATSQIRLHTTYGTGVKNPTFSQLDNPSQLALKPETSKAWDSGLEYNFRNFNSYVDLTYFNAKYNDRIIYIPNTFPARYENQDENSQGIELSAFTEITKELRINGQYTYLDTQDGTAQKNELLRRPKHSASINTNYKFTSKLSSSLSITYRGKSLDFGNSPSDPNSYLGGYTLVNLNVSYQFTNNVSMTGRIENMLNKDYETVRGYATDPISTYIGMTFK